MVLRNFVLVLLLLVPWAGWAFDHQHQRWDQLLQQHVHWSPTGHASNVDYQQIKADPALLEQYLAELSTVSLAQYQSWSQPEQLAFLINAYNAFTVQLILTRYPKLDSIRQLGSVFRSPWKKSFITLLDEQRSLDDIEHGMIRQQFDEPRIHFAVVCASIGCPALANKAYTPDNLELMLEQGMTRFLSDKSRNYFDADQQTLYISKIFDWYGEDFSPSVPFVLSRYATELGGQAAQVQRAKVKYLEYDWALNDHRR